MRTLTLNEVTSISGAGHYQDSWGFFGSYIGNTAGSLVGWGGASRMFDPLAASGVLGKIAAYGIGAGTIGFCAAAGATAGYLMGSIAGSAVDAVVYLQNRERK